MIDIVMNKFTLEFMSDKGYSYPWETISSRPDKRPEECPTRRAAVVLHYSSRSVLCIGGPGCAATRRRHIKEFTVRFSHIPEPNLVMIL